MASRHDFSNALFVADLNFDVFCGVYCFHNILADKVYVGSSVNVKARVKTHLRQLARGKHSNLHFQRAYDLYGRDAFRLYVLCQCSPGERVENEQKWIDGYGAACREKGYNIVPRADRRQHSEETKARIAASNAGHTMPEATRVALLKANVGKRRTNGWRKGRVHSPEARELMSKKSKGHKRWLGKTHTEETKRKMSVRVRSAEEVARLSERMREFNAKQARPAFQKSLDGNLIKVWGSVKEAAQSLGIDPSGLCKACRNGRVKKGFLWGYQ